MDATTPVSRLDALRTHPAFVRRFSKLHVRLYRWSGGRVLGRVLEAPILLLSTVGRRSGRTYTTPIIYLRDGTDLVVAASNGGAASHPAWWLNLRATGKGTVEIGRERRPVRPEIIGEGPERERLWGELVRIYPDYDLYRRKTERLIPLIRLAADPTPG